MDSKIFISLILLLSFLGTISATHFRFGTISWRIPTASQPNVIEFYSSFTFRRSFFGKPNVGSVINPGTFTFGDGSAYVQLYLTISAINIDADWASGTFTTTYSYPENVVANYTAMHTSAGRILELNNNPNLNWNVTCTVSVGRYVNNSNGVRVPNTAPVSNNLPIVSVYSNYNNTFRITASDAEGQTLTYSLGTAKDMGGTSLTLAPNLSVTPDGLVIFNTVGVANGYWCTQIKFSDGLCYSVVDFLIYVAPRPMICNNTCSNYGASCNTSNDCTSCSGANSTKCIVASPPYLVSPPTPVDGTSFSVNINIPISFTWSAYSPMASSVTITSSSLPTAAVLTTTLTGSRQNQTLTWTPTLSDVGVYVITLGCADSSGQSCTGQTSFSVNVLKPYCGHGTIYPTGCDPSWKNCTCICDNAGFDPNSQCYDCLSGYYGSTCAPCPTCANGVCSDGISGVGTCICNVGWQGSNCSFPLNKPCNTSTPNYIVSSVSTGQYVNPSLAYTYLTKTSSSALSVPLTTAMPSTPTKLDILLLVDVTKSITASMLSFFQETYAKTFFDSIRKLVPNSYFGVSSFTDRPDGLGCSTSDYPFRLHLPLSTDYSDFISALNTYMKTTSLGCNDTYSKNDSQMDALIGAAAASSGWRSDAYKIVILITDSTFWDGTTVYASSSSAKAALVASNVVPIFLITSTPASTYSTLVSSTLGFGLASTVSSDYSNVFTLAYTQVTNVLNKLSVLVAKDTYSIVTSVGTASKTVTLPVNVTNNIQVKYPSTNLDSVANYPEITINMMGWGTATIVAQVNRAPVPVVCTATTREDISVEVPISGSDADGNALTVFVTKLPTSGYLTVNKSTTAKVAVNIAYTIPDGTVFPFFYYIPNLHYYGSDTFNYYVSDGCSVSSTISCSLTINYYNYPPTAIGTYASIYENTPSIISLNGSDVETATSQLVYYVTSLPDSSLGVLKRVSTGNLVVLNERLNVGENTLLFVPVTYACCDTASFTFQVVDADNQTSTMAATAGVNIIGVNQTPIVSASNVTVERGSTTAIIFNVFDPDRNDQETFTVANATSGFTTSSNVAISTSTTTKTNVGTVTVNSAGSASVTVYYTAPSNQVGTNFAKITFWATDASSAISNSSSVFVSINTVNRLPAANPAGPITLFQDSSSTVWNLNGTDADAADANTLKVQITSLPTKGTLAQVSVGDVTSGSSSSPFTLTNPNVYYRTNSTGEDSFTFQVVDLVGGVSSQQVVRIVITAVNHAPTANTPTVTTPEDTPVIIQISPYDQDGDTVSVIIIGVSRGSVWQYDGTQITSFPATLTDNQYRFKFQGAQDEFGSPYSNISFYINDNQGKPNSNSSVVTGSITVTPVNDPPVAIPISITVNENSGPVSFTLNATDVETPNNLSAFLVSLPAATSLGTITTVSGSTLGIRSYVPQPRIVTFYPNQYQYGTTTFTFGANDGTVDSDNTAAGTITVVHVNHPPSATATSPVTASRAVSLSISLVVRDYDIGDNLTVSINGFNGKGVLSYNGVNITSASYSLAPVQITSSFNSRTIILSYLAPANATPGANFASFSFDVTDQGNLKANTTNVSISIANNNIPVANPAGPLSVAQDYRSDLLPLNGTDADAADANSLTVIIQTLPTKGKLYVYTSGTYTVITNPNTPLPSGVTSVTYLTNLRGGDAFTFAVSDLLGAMSSSVSVSIAITNTNHPPNVYWVGNVTANEDTMLNITNIQASDPDGDKVTVMVVTGPAKGTLTQYGVTDPCIAPCNITDSAYRLSFMPLPDDNSVNGAAYATISIVATDGMAMSSTIVGSLFITPVNDAPVAYNSTVPTPENQSINITLNGTDIDTPATQVSAIIQTLPSSSIGTITAISGAPLQIGSVISGTVLKQLTFVPVQWAVGVSSFSFLLNDGELNSQLATITINVTAVRQKPICTSENVVVLRGSATSFSLTVFDPDQGETYTFYLTRFQQSGGIFTNTASGATISSTTYVLASGITTRNYYGEVDVSYGVNISESSAQLSFGFVVSDGYTNSTECAILVNSTTNAPPTATPVFPVVLNEDGTSSNFILNGTDDDPYMLYVVITDLPIYGVLYQDSPRKVITSRTTLDYGSFSVFYVPNKLWYGADNFTFAVRDLAGSVSPKLTVNITVNHVNHPPIVVGGGNVSTLEDTPVYITQVLASDPDGDTVQVFIKYAPARGQFEQYTYSVISSSNYPALLTSPSYDFIFVPGLNENGDNYANFTVYGTDPSGNKSTEITVMINVIPVDDPPVAIDVPFYATEQTTVTYTNITLNATDVDTDLAYISATVLSLPSSSVGILQKLDGTAVAVGDVIPSRIVTFVTASGYTHGNTSFSFNVKDQTSYSANTATVSIAIQHVNHAPTASDAIIIAIRGVPSVIALAGYDPDTMDVFSFIVDSITPGTGGVFALINDTVINSSNISISTGVTNTATGSFSTSITYTAPVTAIGAPFANISYHIEDEAGGKSTTKTITIDIAPNSAPIATPATFIAYQDTASPAVVLNGTDADPADANSLLLIIASLPQLGVLIVNSTFNITSPNTVLPAGTAVSYYTTVRGSDSFTYYVEDNLDSHSGTVNAEITIVPVNHPPTAVFHGPATGLEDNNITITQIALSDPDGDTVQVYVTSIPAAGTLTQYDGTPITTASPSSPVLVTEPHGWLVYVPALNANGNPLANFSFYADDGQGANNSKTAIITATISVTAVNDPPVAINGLTSALENTADILISLNVSDVDTDLANVSVYLTTLPDRTIGSLVDPTTMNPIQLLAKLPSRQVLLQLVQYAHGDTSFNFFANDGELDSATGGVQTISIANVNQPPTASAASPVNAPRNVPTAITLQVFDPDMPEFFNITVVSCNTLGGYFSYNNENFTSISNGTPLVLASNVTKSTSGNSFVVYFTAPDNMYGDNFASISLQAFDAAGASSSIINVSVNALKGAQPSANPAGPISFLEEASSTTFSLNGTDADVADAGDLRVVITSLPTKATLYMESTDGSADKAINSTGVILTNPTVYLVGNSLQYGSDLFTFAVVDLVNQQSTPSTVSLTIIHVNHPPVAGAIITPGLMNSNLTFKVFGQDPDNDLPLSIYVVAAPSVGYLFQSDGTPIPSTTSVTSPTLVTDFNGKLIYMAPTNQWGLPITTISLVVNDNTGANNSESAIYTTDISMQRVDLAPTVANLSLSMPQNTALNFTVPVTDVQNYVTYVTIVTFPLYGNLYRADGSEITPSNPITNDGFVTYTPPLKAYDNGAAPYATITYRGTATNSSLSSNVGTATIYVNKTNSAPVFTGATQYNIPQDTNLTMLLTGSSETGNYGIEIISIVAADNGYIYTKTCMGDETCSLVNLTAGEDLISPEMEYIVRFTPPAGQYGNNYANFTIIVTDKYGYSDPVTITINIYHINIAPTIVPWTYDTVDENDLTQTYNWSNAIVNIIEGSDTVIAWKLQDPDTPQVNLTSIVYALPYRGQLFYVNQTATGYIAGESLSKSGSVVKANEDGLFRVVYRPEAGKSGNNYATFSLIGFDQIDQSGRIALKINVRHINLAPWVIVTNPDWNTTAATPVIVTGVSMNDTDASFYDEMFRLTLSQASGESAPSGSILDITYFNNGSCIHESNVSLICKATLANLNQLLTQISVEVPVAGSYQLTIFVDDLGAGSANRSINHLNATGYIYITAFASTTQTASSSTSNSVMTAVVASAAGTGAAAAAGVWRYMKKKSPPTIDFFGSDGVETQVTNNPLFEETDSMSFANVLYEGAA